MRPISHVAYLIALAGFSGVSLAFEKDLHGVYADKGVQYLRACDMPKPTPEQADIFEAGTKSEDDWWQPSRAVHWHYAKNPRMSQRVWLPPLPTPFVPHIDVIFKRRLEEMANAAAAKNCGKVFELAGRLTHYIQDMRVPAHVIPIHHGTPWEGDDFDGHRFDYPTPKPDAQTCTGLAAEAGRLSHDAIYARRDRAREETLASIDKPVRGTEACTWTQAFWCNPHKGEACDEAIFDGFGSYREVHGQRQRFGNEKELSCGALKLTLTKPDYSAFFKPGYEAMLKDVAFMLLYAQALTKVKGCNAAQ